MECDVRYDAETETIVLKVTGDVEVEAVKQAAPAVTALIREHRCRRMLTDMRGAAFRLDTFQIYRMPETMAQAGIGSLRRAMVFSRDLEDAKFYETVTANRAQFMKVFTDMDEARRWLASE